jgi:hypothetical protein
MKPLCCSDFSRDSLSNLTGKILRVTGNSFRVTGKFHLQTCFGRRPPPGTKSRPTNRQLVHFIAAPPCNRFSRCALILDWASRIWPKRLRGEALAPGRERLKRSGLRSRLSEAKACALTLNRLSVTMAPAVCPATTGERAIGSSSIV